MRVLVACEYSGTVRDAFTRLGHTAMSCDLLPSDTPGLHHQGDVREILHSGYWDLVIAHPPCTYLCRAGARWLHDERPSTPTCLRGQDRWRALHDAVDFLRMFLECGAPRIAVENPRPYSAAAALIGSQPDQYVQPYEFGHLERKQTGLWLRNLPPLVPTSDLKAETLSLPKSVTDKVHRAAPGPDRWKLRSITYKGIADAMATQWGGLE
jgi:hypothetical protein